MAKAKLTTFRMFKGTPAKGDKPSGRKYLGWAQAESARVAYGIFRRAGKAKVGEPLYAQPLTDEEGATVRADRPDDEVKIPEPAAEKPAKTRKPRKTDPAAAEAAAV